MEARLVDQRGHRPHRPLARGEPMGFRGTYVKVAVYGLSHLGSVTAACLAEAGIDTISIDEDAAVIAALQQGKAPLFEPGLDELLSRGLKAGRLSFRSDLQTASD